MEATFFLKLRNKLMISTASYPTRP